MIDLGKWLGEEYRIPDELREEERASLPTGEEEE